MAHVQKKSQGISLIRLIFSEVKLKLRLYFRFCNRSKSGFKIGESNGERKTSKITQTSLLVRSPQWRMKPEIRLQTPRLGGMMEETRVLVTTEDACHVAVSLQCTRV